MRLKTTVSRHAVAFLLLLATVIAPPAARGQTSNRERLTTELREFKQKSVIPGFSVALINDREVRYSAGFGSADLSQGVAFTPSTVNWIASISKTFVALAAMKLVEQKKLDLDAPINSYLAYRIDNPAFPESPITLRQLLTHTSSINDSFETHSVGDADVVLENENDTTAVPEYIRPNVDWHRMGKKIPLDAVIRNYTQPGGKWYGRGTFSKHEPGTRFEYSNLAVSIAGRIVEIRSGMPLAKFTKKYIFDPLGMKNTAWDLAVLDQRLVSKIYVPDDEKQPTRAVEYPQYYVTGYPPSGLKSSADDLASFVREMIRGHAGRGKLLRKSTYAALFEPQFKTKRLPKASTDQLAPGEDIAIAWMISRSGEYHHLGGNIGVAAFVTFNPVNRTGTVAISNMRVPDFSRVQEIVGRFETLVAPRGSK